MLRKPVAYAVLFSLAIVGCGDKSAQVGGDPAAPEKEAPKSSEPSGRLTELKTEDVKVGKGEGIGPGDDIWLLYTGTLANGKVFDSTAKHDNKAFKVTLGQGQVIQGWDKGLVGMKVGGERKLSIPAKMAYADQSQGDVPPNADLYFDVHLLAAVKADEKRTILQRDIKEGTGREVKAGDTVTIDYEAKVPTGEVGDTTYKPHKPISFKVGKGQAMDGIDAGVVGMKVGGKRELTVPPALGPTQATKTIPFDTVLTITVELRKIQ